MREFYRTYEDAPEVLTKAMTIGWTQNAVILEAELILQDRAWYIRAVRQFGWSKLTLTEKIRSCAHNEASLDFQNEVCYTEKESTEIRNKSDNKDNFLMLQQYLQEPDSRICDEGSGDENRIGKPIPHRVRRHQY